MEPDIELAHAYRTLAQHYAYLGQYSLAVATLDEAEQGGLDRLEILQGRAGVNLRFGEWERASAALAEIDTLLSLELARTGQTEDYLTSRADWTSFLTLLALARGQADEARRWADGTCNFMRLVHWQDRIKRPAAEYRAHVLLYDASLRRGDALPAELEALSCDDVEPVDSLYALIARARAGFPVNGPAEQAHYGTAPDALLIAQVVGADGHPLYRHFVEMMLNGTRASEQTIEQQSEYSLKPRERLDRLCEAYYFYGMYYRYVQHDEAQGRRWLQKAVDTWSLASLEYSLARFELGLPPRPELPAAVAAAVQASER